MGGWSDSCYKHETAPLGGAGACSAVFKKISSKWSKSDKPGPHQQQCRSNVRLCRKDEISTQNSFDIVAVFGNKVERCFDIVAGVDRAL